MRVKTVCPVCHLDVDVEHPHRNVEECVDALDTIVTVDEALRRLLREKHRVQAVDRVANDALRKR